MSIYELPSLIALLFKLGLLTYAARSPVKNSLTKAYLWLLALLSLHNFLEFAGFIYYYSHGLVPAVQTFGFIYVALLIPAIAVLLHVSLRLSLDQSSFKGREHYLLWLYLPIIPLEYLLIFTDQLVLGFKPFLYTILRVPGPLYSLFETYAVIYLLAALSNLVYGARASRTPVIARTRNQLWLLALAPTVFLLVYLIVANHFGWTKLTSTFYLPITLTFFLVVTTYATHQYRLFDIEFYIPWSKIRKRKTALHARMREVVSEIAGLSSSQQALNLLASMFSTPVALHVGNEKPVLSLHGGGQQMADFPLQGLRKLDKKIIVAYEIAEQDPDTYSLMKRHGVGAIVPFYPHTKNASGWLLLGGNFSEQVYTPLDFRLVEQVFARLADMFLDRLVAQRAALTEARREIRTLGKQHLRLTAEVARMKEEANLLRQENSALIAAQRLDSAFLKTPASAMPLPFLLGMGSDASMSKALQQYFPHVVHHRKARTVDMRKYQLADILLFEVEDRENPELLHWIRHSERRAYLLFGSEVGAFVENNASAMRGRLVEIIPAIGVSLFRHRIEALTALQRHIYDIGDPEQPLIGGSPAFVRFMHAAQTVLFASEPVLIATIDYEQAIAVARYLHRKRDNSTGFNLLRVREFMTGSPHRTPDDVDSTVARLLEEEGTLVVTDVGMLPLSACMRIAGTLLDRKKLRFIGVGDPADHDKSKKCLAALYPFSLPMPTLSERQEDIPLLGHYFATQFNLQTAAFGYLKRAQVEAAIVANPPQTLTALRHIIYDALRNGEHFGLLEENSYKLDIEKTLEEHLAEQEARIIRQTLKRCGGQKTIAARVLGVRRTTFLYKLAKLGLLENKRSKKPRERN